MIVKYPWVLMGLIPVIALMYGLRRHAIHHAIRFPKAAWMRSLVSKKATRLIALDRWLERGILVMMVVALAQPQWITAHQYSRQKGIDIVAILDTSGSMNAEDFSPKNRMTVAKETLQRFVKKRPSDRIGLVIFGTDALTASPLTTDHAIIINRINDVAVGDAGDGTAIGLAIATGVNRLIAADAASKVIILITDGVNNAGQIDPISAANFAKTNAIRIYTIGIGDKEGAPIPIYHPTYGKRYARYPNGQLILTEFDDRTLKKIAETANGQYFNATNATELADIYATIDQLEKTDINTTKTRVVHELFPYIIAFIACMIILRQWIGLGPLIGVLP
jgi:Ca-activated chloride channel family protein